MPNMESVAGAGQSHERNIHVDAKENGEWWLSAAVWDISVRAEQPRSFEEMPDRGHPRFCRSATTELHSSFDTIGQ